MRHSWMDLLRGISVLLIVVYHANPLSETAVGEWFDHFFQPYRVPLLLVLSGMLLPQSLRKGLKTYFDGKIRRIVWPLLVWTLAMMPFLADDLLRSTSPMLVLVLGTHLWFLWVLVAAYAIAPLTHVVPPILIALALWGIALWLPVPVLVHALAQNAPFFFLGAMLSSRLSLIGRLPGWVVTLLAAVAVTGGFYNVRGPLELSVSTILISIAGLLASIWVAMRLRKNQVTKFLEWCGRNSIVIYVAHRPVQSLFPPFFGAESSLGRTLGLITSLTVCFLLVRYRHLTPWLYEWPRLQRIRPRLQKA